MKRELINVLTNEEELGELFDGVNAAYAAIINAIVAKRGLSFEELRSFEDGLYRANNFIFDLYCGVYQLNDELNAEPASEDDLPF